METLATIPFYTSQYPQKDDLIIAEVIDFNDIRVNIFLPEYCRAKAFLPTSEINVRRGKRIKDYVKPGQEIVVQVTNVLEEKDEGASTATVNIDVSMKVVKEEEAKAAFEKYHRALKVHKTIGAAVQYKPDLASELYRELYEEYRTEDLYSVFEKIRAGEGTSLTISPKFAKALINAIEERMPAPLFTQEAEMIITFPKEKNGAEMVVAKLDRLSRMENVKVFVVAPPKYKVVVSAQTKKKAEDLLQLALTM